MLKMLERNVASVDNRLILLAPGPIPNGLTNGTASSEQHARLIQQVQRLRGRIYLADGALRPEQLTADGRHETAEDARSWHLITLDEQEQVSGCIWYLEHTNPAFDALRIRHASLAQDPTWAHRLRRAVRDDVARTRDERIGYAEVGGWAVAESSRLTDCLMLLLSTYALSQTLGGALVVATATLRHSSAAVLRRIGGARLQADGCEIPSYFDPNYDCEMELLRFDTRRPTSRFARLVDSLKEKLATIQVVAPTPGEAVFARPLNARFAHMAAAARHAAVIGAVVVQPALAATIV
jgi:hypothetical protein